MEKESAEKIARVLSEVPETLRALDAKRNAWKARAKTAEAELKKQAQDVRVRKLAAAMREKGFSADMSEEAQIEALNKQADAGRLETIEAAVSMRPNEVLFGEVDGSAPGSGGTDLERYITGEID